MTGEPQCAVGVPNVGPFGDPLLLVELAVAAEEHGWDGFFVWDHLLYHDQRWDVAGPVTVIAAVAARTARIRIGVLVNVLARRRIVRAGVCWRHYAGHPLPQPYQPGHLEHRAFPSSAAAGFACAGD